MERMLIIGIGNPESYINTYHNIGDAFIVWLAGDETHWKEKKHAQFMSGKDYILARTTTFMNESGIGVREMSDFFDIKPEHLIVIHDDTDLALGEFVIKKGGGSGGHNGIKSIISHLGTKEFWHLKIGVRPDHPHRKGRKKAGEFVLSTIGKKEQEILYNEVFPEGAKSALKVIEKLMPSEPDRISAIGKFTS